MPLPNIIFILTDDQGYWALGASGNREIHTPHLDRLAASGARFENMFCVSPVCSPARASLLTGRIPSQHGVLDWLRSGNLDPQHAASLGYAQASLGEAAIPFLDGLTAYTDILAQHGYTCGLSGKWHLGDSLNPQKSFSFWRVIPGGGSDYQHAFLYQDGRIAPAGAYLTDVIGDNALAFLDEQAGRPGPFYLGIHTNAPHSPWDEAQHPADLRELYRDCPFESVPDLPEAHPNQINSAPRGTGARRRELLTGYYASISGIDRLVGRVLDWLDAHQMRDKTMIVFSSDNGMNMGHHGLWGKGNATFPANMYEESVKVPFIISHPGSVPAGSVIEAPLSHYDFFPTLLETLGLPNPEAESLPGRSYAPLLRGEPLPEHPVFLYDEYGPTRMVRTRRWKYIHRYPYGPHELYDLENDPGETTNRAGDPAYDATLTELRAALHGWFVTYADPRIDGAREPVTGKGQLARAGSLAGGQVAFSSDWYYIDANGRARNPADLPDGPDRSF